MVGGADTQAGRGNRIRSGTRGLRLKKDPNEMSEIPGWRRNNDE